MTAAAGPARGPGAAPAAGRRRSGWRLLTGTGPAASAALGLLVLASVFLAVAGPRATLLLRTRALQHALAQGPAGSNVIIVSAAPFSLNAPGNPLSAGEIDADQSALHGYLARYRLPIAARAAWSSSTTSFLTVPAAARSAYSGGHPPQLQLIYRSQLRRYARLTAGQWPGPVHQSGSELVLPVAFTRATAARFSVRPGSVLPIASGVAMQVTGVITPAAPRDEFWTEFGNVTAPDLYTQSPQQGDQSWWQGGAFLSAGALAATQARASLAGLTVNWVYPLRLGAVNADQAAGLAARMNAAAADGSSVVGDGGSTLTYSIGPAPVLTSFFTADQALRQVLALLEVSLAALAATVVLLCARLVTEQRAEEFALLRARGAAWWQVSGRALRGGAAVALPAAALAAAAAVAVTPGASQPAAWWLAGLVLLAALAGPALLALRTGVPARRARMRGQSGRRLAAARRVVTDATLVLLAVGGLVVLRLQGNGPGAADAYTAAGPALAAIPVAVVAIRLMPLAVRGLLRPARRGDGVVAFVGLARGSAAGSAAVLPVFALVLALAVVAFSGMVRSGVRAGQVAASWQEVPSGAIVGGPASAVSLTAAAVRAISAVPGAGQVTPVRQAVADLPDSSGDQLTAVIVSPRQYAAAVAAAPGPRFPAAALGRPRRGQPVPVLASPGAARQLGRHPAQLSLSTGTVRVAVAGRLAATPAAAGAGGTFVVLPLWAAGGQRALPPTMVLLSGTRVDQRALRAAVARYAPGTPVLIRAQVLAGLQDAPLPHAAGVFFAAGTAAAAGFCAVILMIMLVLGGRGRDLMLARLATMGLPPAKARRLAAAEIAPTVLAALAGGLACALILVPLLGPAVSLAAFTGSSASVPLQANLAVLAAVAVGLVLIAAAVLGGQRAAAARRGTSRALRIDE